MCIRDFVKCVTFAVHHTGPSHQPAEGFAGSRPHGLACGDEHLPSGGFTDQMPVAGIHVDRRDDASGGCPLHMLGKTCEVDEASGIKREQDRGDALDPPLRREQFPGVGGGASGIGGRLRV